MALNIYNLFRVNFSVKQTPYFFIQPEKIYQKAQRSIVTFEVVRNGSRLRENIELDSFAS